MSGWTPEWGVSAGEIIQEKLDELGWSQAEAARRLDLTPKHVNRIIKGRAYFSADVAIRLERATGMDAALLLRMQADYQLHLARRVETRSEGET